MLRPPQRIESRDIESRVQEKKSKTLPEQISELNEKIEMITGAVKKGKSKPFNFKWGVRTQLKKVAKKNKLMVFLLGTNRNCDAQIVDVKNGYFVIDNVPRKCTMDYIYLWQGKIPCVFIPEWSLEPIGLEDYYKKNPDGIPNAVAQKMVIGAIESGEVLTKKKFEAKTIVWILLGVIILGYILFSGGSVT